MHPKIIQRFEMVSFVEASPWAVLGVLIWKFPAIIRAFGDVYVDIKHVNAEIKEKHPPHQQ